VLERRDAVVTPPAAGFFIDRSSGVSALLALAVKWLIENLLGADWSDADLALFVAELRYW